jgi:hypothetical protein
MGNNDINKNENILVKVDDNNLIYIDPNSVVNGKNIEPRDVPSENLMVYVNLEADLVPRTTLAENNTNNPSTPVSIAQGSVNFLKNSQSGDLDTKWTDAFLVTNEYKDMSGKGTGIFYQNDATSQTFGITSITMSVKGYTVPQVSINFIDVRGKTLFESPTNSPYRAFFHLPWPIFYLTIKGYYGKAVKYRLHLTKFSSKFNETNGNFDINCTFIGSTYAFLMDIPLVGALNAPYMYGNQITEQTVNNVTTKTVKTSRSSKGYMYLKGVYDEYKKKGLIDQNFPVKTLREVIILAKNLDEILEREILKGDLRPKIFNGLNEFGSNLNTFSLAIQGWQSTYLTTTTQQFGTTDVFYKLVDSEHNSTKKIVSADSDSLSSIIQRFKEFLTKSQILTQKLDDITFNSSAFKKEVFSYADNIGQITSPQYYRQNDAGQFFVNIDAIKNKINLLQNQFDTQYIKFEAKIEDLINQIIKDKTKGFGFDPTIKNLFAVICANADVYIKLMKDVHDRAFSVGQERKTKISGFSDETPGNDNIYPWPQIKILSKDKNQKEIVYPGIKKLRASLNSDDSRLWPEVEFVEEYQKVASKKVDNLANKESVIAPTNFKIDDNSEIKYAKPISVFLNLGTTTPYYDKSLANVIYEIYERGNNTSFYEYYEANTGKTNVMVELANQEFENLKLNFSEDLTIANTLASIKGFNGNNNNNGAADQSLENLLLFYSPYERYPYYQDKLDTTDYIIRASNKPFLITHTSSVHNTDKSQAYPNLSAKVKQYAAELYRNYIYPFNSPKYLSYLNQTEVKITDMQLSGVFTIDTTDDGLVSGPKSNEIWFNRTNVFTKNLNVGNGFMNILNTTYFHNQLLYDFSNNGPRGKYKGAAYLLLNSLAFYDLQDYIPVSNGIRMSHMFKEYAATHYIPYHLLVKWGSIYHRYKTFITTGTDILAGVVDNVNITKQSQFQTMFVGSETDSTKTNFNADNYTFNYYSGITTVGIHPYYDAIYHQIVNGYAHFDLTNSNSYQTNINLKSIYTQKNNKFGDNIYYYSAFVDNSTYTNGNDYFYTILPSANPNPVGNLLITSDIYNSQQNGFSVIMDIDTVQIPLVGLTFSSYQEYNVDTNGFYSTNGFYREVLDLIGTFSPDILDYFENLFLNFSSERENVEIPDVIFPDYVETVNNQTTTYRVYYQNFQNLLQDLVTVPKLDSDKGKSYTQLISELPARQSSHIQAVSDFITSPSNLIKVTLGNPKEYDLALFSRFATNLLPLEETYGTFNINDVNNRSFDYIKLYCGDDVDGYYYEFFLTTNIQYSEENVLLFRPLILIYAGYRKNNGVADFNTFKNYIITNILNGYENRKKVYFEQLLKLLPTLKPTNNNNKINIIDGYNDESLKQQAYEYFKTFNDKWSSGNSIGQRTLLEEFIFLDKANRDIGSKAYISLDKIRDFNNAADEKTSLFSALTKLLAGTDFDIRGMPSYVNFYGTDYSTTGRIRSSRKVAKDVFGTFLEVDYQESTPKIIIQYVGTTSKQPADMPTKDNYLYNDDGFDFGDPNNNPVRVTVPNIINPLLLNESNRVVGFEVNVGDQNQSMFKSVQLDQESLRNTSEFFQNLENVTRSETGASTYAIDTNLFELYRMRSYTCTVTSLGNAMIQPTMYFYLKNVPMFRGSYWITDVTHDIRPNNIITKFTGVKLNKAALPDPQDSFIASYKIYFERILSKAAAKQPSVTPAPTTETTVKTKEKSAKTDMGSKNKPIQGESIVSDIGIDGTFAIPYNGYNGEPNIQKVTYKNDTYYKAPVAIMGGNNYVIDDNIEMSLFNKFTDLNITGGSTPGKIKWSDIKNNSANLDFYSLRFQTYDGNLIANFYNYIRDSKTTFLNPNKNDITVVINPRTSNNVTPANVSGPINVGPVLPLTTANTSTNPQITYGVGLSRSLMKKLKLSEGDIVYFKLE